MMFIQGFVHFGNNISILTEIFWVDSLNLIVENICLAEFLLRYLLKKHNNKLIIPIIFIILLIAQSKGI